MAGQTIGGIPGITFAGTTPAEPPIILMLGAEKMGKSTTAISLLDWPTPGKMPLVIAFDASGPDSCAQLGYPIHNLKVRDYKGNSVAEKTINVVDAVEAGFMSQSRAAHPYGSIVVDCASSLCQALYNEQAPLHKDGRGAYGAVLAIASRFFWRLTSIGVPTIWLAWLRDPTEDPKTKRIIEGGASITGSFKNILAGKATNIILLDREKRGVGTPGADAQGYVRLFHTKPYANIGLGGRYALPEPMPAHLGLVLSTIMSPPQMAQMSLQQQPPQQQQIR